MLMYVIFRSQHIAIPIKSMIISKQPFTTYMKVHLKAVAGGQTCASFKIWMTQYQGRTTCDTKITEID